MDNGICLKIKDSEKFGSTRLPDFMPRANWEDEYGYDWELMYWRKCWNVRSIIFDILDKYGISREDADANTTPLTLDMLFYICTDLMSCYTREWWNENDESIWDADEMLDGPYRDALARTLRLIGWLQDKDPESYKIYFYDSY